MYAAQPKLETAIQGWYFHPYGPPMGTADGDGSGIESLPLVQAKMTSGQNNIIVSEVGYCDKEVYQGKACGNGGITNAEAENDMKEMLDQAKPYHEEGWLRALVVYSRNDRGWAMQEYPTNVLTKDGEALDAFAESLVGWSVQPTVSPNKTAYSQGRLEGVSCLASTNCVGVGWYTNESEKSETLAEHWNGDEWSVQPTPSTGGTANHLQAVSCTSPTACTAVGWYNNGSNPAPSLAERWNGTEWTIQTVPSPTGAKSSRLYGVSCSSLTVCSAVGEYVNGSNVTVTFAEQWEAGEWKVKTSQSPAKAELSELRGVSCTSSTVCTAVGFYHESGHYTLGESWNGTEWTIQTTQNPSGATGSYLYGVSCTSSSACTATGVYSSSAHVYLTLAERWNGSAWTTQTTPTPEGATESGFYGGVSCWSSTGCVATGEYKNNLGAVVTLAEEWTGSEWIIKTTPNRSGATASYLSGVSCVTSIACVAGGWYEGEVRIEGENVVVDDTLAEADF